MIKMINMLLLFIHTHFLIVQYWETQVQVQRNTFKSLNTSSISLNDVSEDVFYVVLVHEVLHLFGLINTTVKAQSYNLVNYSSGFSPYNSSIPENVYFGINGTNGYKTVLYENGISIENIDNYLPIEDDFGSGTARAHPEEGIDGNYSLEIRTILGVQYPVVTNDIMTGFINNNNFITDLTVGCLEDIGFVVNYNSSNIKIKVIT